MQAPMTIKQYVSQMRKIPGGRFTMGRTYKVKDERWVEAEVPAHPVDVSAFRLGATPVTVGMWREYLRVNSSLSMPEPPEWGWIDSHPMVNVSWNDIMGEDGKGGYCAWASRVSGVRLLLPTEAQWECAAKGGNDQKYPWGNEYDDSKLWCSVKTAKTKTAPVVRSSNIYRNTYGLTDMVGNVWHWCSDLYAPYSSVSQTDPIGPRSTSDNDRCVRGGSWLSSNPDIFRCAFRIGDFPDGRSFNGGFRLSAGPK
jgi:sulfatase modifying factor 1